MQKVILLTHTPDPEKIVAAAAKLNYSSSDVETLMDKLNGEAISRFVEKLVSMGHESPTEHASFTFGIEGVSRALMAQITRHRIATFSVQSQRYVRMDDFKYVIPPEIEKDGHAVEAFVSAMDDVAKNYLNLAKILKQQHKDRIISERGGLDNIDEKQMKRIDSQADKMAIEDARFCLPNACETKMVVTMNARSLNNFFRLRCCNRAQWEIRAVAEKMLIEVKKVAPSLFANAGPSCAFGPCAEGAMSCGKATEVRDYYKNLIND